MGWSCDTCTFENASGSIQTCEICAAPRRGKEKIVLDLTLEKKARTLRVADNSGSACQRTDPNRQMTQTNLFCAFVPKTMMGPKPESRKRKESAASQKPAPQADRKRMALPHATTDFEADRQVVWNAPYPKLWETATKNMSNIFNIRQLRNLQRVAIQSALNRQNQILVMATGGGKSLCYQLPATVLGGVTLVISPLIALMVDQVQALNDKGVSAALLSSSNGAAHNNEVLEQLLGRSLLPRKKQDARPLKPLTLVYGTPELVQTERFKIVLMELYAKNRIALFAIDEAHCLSTWGHDFRPAYRKLQWLRTSFPSVPCIACTATATPKVISDIRETLLLKEGEAPCHMGSFNRPNVSYQVRFKESLDAMSRRGAIGDLVEFVKIQHADATEKSAQCSGIIYVHKRQDTELLAGQITKAAGIRAAAYHAGLKDAERTDVQQQWMRGTIQIAVATVAFGMGIDLPHVRYVVHWTLAKTVEGFYQESGRAGRDGLPAVSLLYFSKDEASKFSYLLRQTRVGDKDPNGRRKVANHSMDALEQMVNYSITPCCRRHYLLKHFGEIIDSKKVCQQTCDYCLNPKKVERAISASQIIKDVLEIEHRSRRTGQASPVEWDGQWSHPHGDSEDVEDCNEHWREGELVIMTSARSQESMDIHPASAPISMPTPQNRFGKASSILAKYEMLESKDHRRVGFVHFKSKSALSYNSEAIEPKSRPVVIPEHLRNNLPDPLRHLSKDVPDTTKLQSSSELSAEADRLKSELARLKEQQEQRVRNLKELSSKTGSVVAPPPPPNLSFNAAKKRK